MVGRRGAVGAGLVDVIEAAYAPAPDGRRYVVARRNDPLLPDPRALTLRERQVVGFVALGQANKLVAYALGITESAVSTHLSAAMRKLAVRTRSELVAFVGALRDPGAARADAGPPT